MPKCDLTKTERLQDWLLTPEDQRDSGWRSRFFDLVYDAGFISGEPEIFHGPDGFPYYALFTPGQENTYKPICICNLIEPATHDGFGVAINPDEESAEWVFTCGDLLNYALNGIFEMQDEPIADPPPEVLQEDEKIFIGSPSEELLPPFTRQLLRRLFREGLGIDDPELFLLSRPAGEGAPQLVFSVFPEDYPDEQSFRARLAAIAWFLPRHYWVTAVPKDSELVRFFKPL